MEAGTSGALRKPGAAGGVCKREGTGQRLTDGLSATWTAGRWLWQFGQGRNFGLLRRSFEKMLEEAADDISLLPWADPKPEDVQEVARRRRSRGRGMRKMERLGHTEWGNPSSHPPISYCRAWGGKPPGWETANAVKHRLSSPAAAIVPTLPLTMCITFKGYPTSFNSCFLLIIGSNWKHCLVEAHL